MRELYPRVVMPNGSEGLLQQPLEVRKVLSEVCRLESYCASRNNNHKQVDTKDLIASKIKRRFDRRRIK